MSGAKAIGLVGGLGSGATIHYYERLTRAFGARQSVPPLFITHADVALTLRLVNSGALEDLGDYLAHHVACLAKAGADFAAIAAVTPHICAPYLKQVIALPFLDLIDCVRAELVSSGARRIAVLGTKFVMQSAMYGQLDAWDVVALPQDAIDFVHDNYVRILSAGGMSGSGADVEGLRALAKDLVRNRGAECVLLAGTELSLAFDESDCGFPALDCARVHIDAILAQAYGGGLEDERPARSLDNSAS